MMIFPDAMRIEEMFGDLWTTMIRESDFGDKVKGISVLFVIHDPEIKMYVDQNGPLFGQDAATRKPTLTMKMSGETVHRFWLKKLNVPKALALGRIRARGPVNKVLKLLPLLKLGYELYPDYCRKYGVSLD